MISRPEFLFPGRVPAPASPAYLQMLAEIGKTARISRRFFFCVGLLLLVPVVLLGAIGVSQWARDGAVAPEVLIAGIILVLAFVAFTISQQLSAPFRAYRLPAAEYARYTVVEAHIIRLGLMRTIRPGYRRYRKIQWESSVPFIRRGWSPGLLVSPQTTGGPLSIADIRVGDAAYVGLDPSGKLPPLFLGVRKTLA